MTNPTDHKSSIDQYIAKAALHVSTAKLSFMGHSILYFACATKLYNGLGSDWEGELLDFEIPAEWFGKGTPSHRLEWNNVLYRPQRMMWSGLESPF